MTRDTSKLATEIRVAHDRVKLDVEQLEKETADIVQATKEAKANPARLSDADIIELGQDLERLNAKSKEANAQLDAFQIHGEKSLAKARAAQTQMQLISALFWPAVFFMLVGFVAWYVCVQRHADTILKQQAHAAKRDADRAAIPSASPRVDDQRPERGKRRTLSTRIALRKRLRGAAGQPSAGA